MIARIPEGENWRDHAIPCPNCDQPVLSETEHYHPETMIDPGWYGCDVADDAMNTEHNKEGEE